MTQAMRIFATSNPAWRQVRGKQRVSTSACQFVPQNNADYTLYDIEGLTLTDGEAAALTVRIIDPRAYAVLPGWPIVHFGRHGNRNKRDDGRDESLSNTRLHDVHCPGIKELDPKP